MVKMMVTGGFVSFSFAHSCALDKRADRAESHVMEDEEFRYDGRITSRAGRWVAITIDFKQMAAWLPVPCNGM